MQKKIIALALAGLASSAAFAQSNVTIYGRADYGFLNRSGDDSSTPNRDSKNEFGSGLQAGSRIGFKGAEDLGNGLKAIFEYEFGVAGDVGATAADGGLATTRHAYVGLTGGFGTLVGGRLDGVRYGIFNKYDAFAGGQVGNFTQMTAQVDRANNAIAYISPTFAGFSAVLAYATHIGNSNPLGLGNQEGTNGANGNDGDAQLNTVKLGYANGPISIDADWERVSFDSKATSGAGVVADDVTVMTLGGSYDFGVVKLAALYDNLQVDGRTGFGDADVDSWFVSASVPLGKFVVKATYGETEDDELNNSKGKKWGIGAQYNLSKRTNIYTSYGSIDNDRNAGYEINPAANSHGAGYGTKGFDLGVAHNF